MNAQATSNHEYAKGEYAIVSDGLAPSKQVSLAARGEGELGDGDFHIWLMAEPAHRRIAALGGISSDNILDTAADAFHAFWSEDSGMSASPTAPADTRSRSIFIGSMVDGPIRSRLRACSRR